MIINLDKCSFILFGVKNKPQIDLLSNNVTSKNSKENKYLESFLITNLTSPCILLSLPKSEYKAQCPYQSTKIYDCRFGKLFPLK